MFRGSVLSRCGRHRKRRHALSGEGVGLGGRDSGRDACSCENVFGAACRFAFAARDSVDSLRNSRVSCNALKRYPYRTRSSPRPARAPRAGAASACGVASHWPAARGSPCARHRSAGRTLPPNASLRGLVSISQSALGDLCRQLLDRAAGCSSSLSVRSADSLARQRQNPGVVAGVVRALELFSGKPGSFSGRSRCRSQSLARR
eukprot:1308715-Prymnesium_polylepis.2